MTCGNTRVEIEHTSEKWENWGAGPERTTPNQPTHHSDITGRGYAVDFTHARPICTDSRAARHTPLQYVPDPVDVPDPAEQYIGQGKPGNHAAKIAPSRRQRVYERDGYRCVLCGVTDDLTIDHIHPRSRGGSNAEENLRTLCRPCNSSKGARI